MNPTTPSGPSRLMTGGNSPVLGPAIIQRIEQALARVGDFGEIRLVIVKGHIKFIQITCSENLTDRPGAY